EARTPPLIDVTDCRGRTRSPVFVLMMSSEMRIRSSCGVSATSRTRPLEWTVESITGAPSSSVSARADMPAENTQLSRQKSRRLVDFFHGGVPSQDLSRSEVSSYCRNQAWEAGAGA